MTYNEAKQAFEKKIMVQHIKSPNITGYIRCFDDDNTGVYLDYHYTFVELKNLQIFDAQLYYKHC